MIATGLADGSIQWPPYHCPQHGEPLAERENVLLCPSDHAFSRRNGIPRFVSGSNYADSFGAQWKRHRLTQLDSYSATTISEDRLRRCLGETVWNTLHGMQALECGCGAGRFTEVLLRCGAYVTSVDLSEAVDSNLANFPDMSRHRVAQADILALPFAREQFDLVVCLGVIQHTPDPQATITALYHQVKPAGYLVMDHYARVGWLAHVTSKPIFRWVMRRRTPERNAGTVRALVDGLLPMHARLRRVPVIRSVFGRFSPVIQYYGVYPELSDELQREWALLDTHDALTDHYKYRRSKEEIGSILEGLGGTDVWCENAGVGVEARARRPRVEPPLTRVELG